MTPRDAIQQIRAVVRRESVDGHGVDWTFGRVRELCNEVLGERLMAISLYQPWATAIACGSKTIETRTWGTGHRGPLAIHAGKRRSVELRESAQRLAREHPVELAGLDLSGLGQELPRGAIVATCHVADCVLMTQAWINERTEIEKALGDFRVGRYGWVLEDVRELASPVTVRGRQGLWSLSEEEAGRVLAEAKED